MTGESELVCYDNFEILHFGGLIMNKKKIFGALIGIVALFVIINVVVMKEKTTSTSEKCTLRKNIIN